MDYLAWIRRLRRFVSRWRAKLPRKRQGECFVNVERPLEMKDIRKLRKQLDRPLPASVVSFLTQAASRLDFKCVCALPAEELNMSGSLFNYWLWRPDDSNHFEGCPEGMVEARKSALANLCEGSWLSEPEWVIDRAFWRHALPLTQDQFTDCLGLWVHDPNEAEPAVVYLSHEDSSYPLSPNFDTFLQDWEYLGYDWGSEYCDSKPHEVMWTRCPAALERRRKLGLESSTFRVAVPGVIPTRIR